MIVKLYNRKTRFTLQGQLGRRESIDDFIRRGRGPKHLSSKLLEQPERGTWVATDGDWELTIVDPVVGRVQAL